MTYSEIYNLHHAGTVCTKKFTSHHYSLRRYNTSICAPTICWMSQMDVLNLRSGLGTNICVICVTYCQMYHYITYHICLFYIIFIKVVTLMYHQKYVLSLTRTWQILKNTFCFIRGIIRHLTVRKFSKDWYLLDEIEISSFSNIETTILLS